MGQFIDLTGKRFGRLVVLYKAESRTDSSGHPRIYYHCRCDCGVEKDILGGSLSKGQVKSCGCIQREYAKSGDSKRTHGMTGTRLHRIWKNIHTRCYNQKNPKYQRYGGRGIKVCDEWIGENGFQNFYDWSLASGYQEDLTIDRIDNDGNYCPENCRWVTNKVQSNNKSQCRYITVDGETKSISEWIDYLGISRWKLYYLSDEETERRIREYLNT